MMSEYAEATEEQKKQIIAIFDLGYSEATIEVETKDDGYYVTADAMYEYLSFKKEYSILTGYHEIARILGVTQGDEVDRGYSPGCETCDWGSSYEIKMRFW